MAFDWLFGKPFIEDAHIFRMRSLTVDLDTVRDVLDIVSQTYLNAGLMVQPASGVPEYFDPERLERASDLELSRLSVVSHDPQVHFEVSFRTQQPYVSYQGGAEVDRDIALRVVEHLLKDGRPRPRFDLVYQLPNVLRAMLALSWLWVLIADTPPLSLAVAGSLVVAYCVWSAGAALWPLRQKLSHRDYTGHRIQGISRTQLRAQRANRRASLRVGLYTGVPIAIIGAISTAIAAGVFDKK